MIFNRQSAIGNRKCSTGRILRWLLVGLAIIAVLGLVFVWIIRALPHIALAQIGQLTNTRIDAESVNLGFDGSVLIKKLVIRPDREQKYDDAILKAQTVNARFSTGSLLLLSPKLKEILVNDFVCDAQYDLDTGRWNVAALRIQVPRDGSGQMPVVQLHQGILQYSKISNGQAKVAASISIHAEFGFDQWTQEGYRFNIRTATLSSGFGKSNLSGFWRPGRITVAGGISSAFAEASLSPRKRGTDIPALEWAWAIDVLAAELNYQQDRNYSLKLRIKDCHSTHSTEKFEIPAAAGTLAKSTAFGALQGFFSRYRPAGTVDIELAASGNFDRLGESTVNGKVYCKDILVCDRHFPYSIEHLASEIDFTQDSVVLNALSGKHGDVDIAIDGLVKGFGPAQQYQLRVTSNNMLLDNDLYAALSTGQKNLWDAFSPSGRIAVDQRFSRKSQGDGKTTLTIELLDAQATYKHFPYPLRNLTGRLFFDRDSVIISDVVSQVGKCKITFNGNVSGYNTERPTCYLSIKADNVPLDSTLAAALPAGQRSFYDQLAMAGFADAQVKIFTLQQPLPQGAGLISPRPRSGGQPKWGQSFLADITLKEASLSVLRSSAAAKDEKVGSTREMTLTISRGKSPLVISNISATAVITPDSISIKEFTGQCSDGEVFLAGGIWFTDQAQPARYHLTVDAKQTQLSEELVDLLPGSVKKIFSESMLQGRINLAADLRKAAEDKEPTYQVAIECLGDSVALKQFAYPLKNVTGKLAITNKTLTFENVTAVPAAGESQITLNGQIALSDGALSQARPELAEWGSFELSASDIPFDQQLGTALNSRGIAPFYSKLSPAGRFDLDSANIKVFAAKDPDFIGIDFAGAVRLKDCRFDLSGVEAQLNALLKAKGLYKIGSGFSAGAISLTADSLRVKGKAITNLTADINYDPDTQSWLADNLFADCYGGKVVGKLELQRPTRGSLKYLVQAGFDRVDLKEFLSDTGSTTSAVRRPLADAESDHTSGIMTGALSIVAEVGDSPWQIGQCRLAIRDMKVGKLSPLAKLLYVLKLTEPKDFAFEQMIVDSYIKGDKLLFEKFDLSGQAIAFSGSGQMDLASDNVDLILTARGKRLTAAEPSVVQSLAKGLGQAVVRMEVTGNVHDPQVTTRALPVIKDSLKILGTKRK